VGTTEVEFVVSWRKAFRTREEKKIQFLSSGEIAHSGMRCFFLKKREVDFYSARRWVDRMSLGRH